MTTRPGLDAFLRGIFMRFKGPVEAPITADRATTNPIEYEGFALADHPSDVITFAVDGLGTVDVYNCANLMSYKIEAVTQTVEVVFVLLEHPYRLALTFHDVRHISSTPDPGPLSELRNLEFVRFVFGEEYLSPGAGTVEFATNLTDYRFISPRVSARLSPMILPDPVPHHAPGDDLV